LIKEVTGPIRLFHPRIMVSVPYGVTSVESRAVQEAVLEAGAREVFLIEQPLAAAIGIDLPINTPTHTHGEYDFKSWRWSYPGSGVGYVWHCVCCDFEERGS